jgi:lipoprotein-releasing system permease protein
MKGSLNFDIAKGLLLARFRQTLVAGVGVTFGIAMFVSLLGFMTGLNQLLDGLILNRTPHIRLYKEMEPSPDQALNLADSAGRKGHFIHSLRSKEDGPEIPNSQLILQALRKDERIIDVSPKVSSQVFFNAGPMDLAGVVNGVNIKIEDKLFLFGDYVVEGNIEDLELNPNSIFLGKGIADKLLAETGDVVQITTSKGEITSLKVAGVFQFGLAELDNTQSYTSLETAQTLLQKPISYVTDIQIKLHDVNSAPVLAREYQSVFGIQALDIQTANSQFETGSSVRTIISYAVGITLLIVAGFGIYNILNMLIYEKMDSIAILKATGFSGKDVRIIFLMVSMMIGLGGGISGLGLGYALSSFISQIPFETPSLPTIKTYPVNFALVYYVIGISFALITTFFAGLLPALKAARIDPVQIIRGK